jgi:hypothetical protein
VGNRKKEKEKEKERLNRPKVTEIKDIREEKK